MTTIEITQGGVIDPEDIIWLGGSYSWRERIRRGGIGSPKVIYANGFADFDQLSHGVPGQTTFANFELLPEGLIVRANCTQRIAAAGLRYEEIQEIVLTGHPIRIKTKRWLKTVKRTVHQGSLTFTTSKGMVIHFAVRVSEFEALKQFFAQEEVFHALYRYQISSDPSQDDTSILDILGMLSD